MFKDLLYYFKYRIQDQREARKVKKEVNKMIQAEGTAPKKRYLFQKMAVAIAAILWLIAAGNVLWRSSNTKGQDKIITAFSNNMYAGMTSGISSYGKYGTVELTDNAKVIILNKIAEEIGINKYTITNSVEEGNNVMTLSQNSVNGDVICKFITVTQQAAGENVNSDQYLYIGITLKNNVNSAFAYEKIVKKIMSEMEIDTIVTVNLKGEIHGKLSKETKDAITSQMLSNMNAKVQAENKSDDVYTIYAYDKNIDKYILIGSSKVNINISMSYNEATNMTELYFSTPINNEDY